MIVSIFIYSRIENEIHYLYSWKMKMKFEIKIENGIQN
nr:MAG TPA: hypothetical protein [Caudoviricetes sp.]